MTLTSHQRPVRGATDVWLTPPWVIEQFGPFDLDPCAAPEPRPWSTAARHITLPTDGLSADWGDAFVWCNPPFGPDAAKWLDRMTRHRNGIALVPARTETRWFVSTVWRLADGILFLHGRPHFHYPNGERGKANSGAPICLVAYGPEATRRLAASNAGTYVPLPQEPTEGGQS